MLCFDPLPGRPRPGLRRVIGSRVTGRGSRELASTPSPSRHLPPATRDPALRCAGLVKRYGDLVVVNGLDLEARHGELLALLGPSGCGKTTTLRLIAGFEELDAGRIEVGGRVVAEAGAGGRRSEPPERRRVGMVFQDYALFPHLSVAKNVAFGLPRGARSEREARVAAALTMVGLAGMGERLPHALSGGQQQRVAVAR